MAKVPALDTKIIILYDTTWGRSLYWFSTNVYISEQLQDGFQPTWPTCRRER